MVKDIKLNYPSLCIWSLEADEVGTGVLCHNVLDSIVKASHSYINEALHCCLLCVGGGCVWHTG